MKKPLPTSVNEEIERRAELGEHPRVIAAAVGCDVTTVYRRITDWRQRTGLLPLRAHNAQVKAQAQLMRARPAQRGLSQDQVTRLLALVADGVLTKDICAELGCSRAVVMRHCKRAGVSNPNRFAPISADVANSIISLIAEGKTQNFVAGYLGVDERTVSRHVARHRDKYGADSLPRKAQGKTLPAETVQKIVRLGHTFNSAGTIAGELGLSPTTVLRHIRADTVLRRQSGMKCHCGLPFRHVAKCVTVTPEVRAARIAARNAARERDRLIVSSQQSAGRRDALYAKIAARIPRWIDAATRDDIISDAYLAMLETAQ